MQKVSGYLPKSGRYTENFRIINSYAASPNSNQFGLSELSFIRTSTVLRTG